MKTSHILAGLLFCCCTHATAADIKDDKLLSAMSAELKRSIARLGHAEKNPLYYLGYEATDMSQWQVTAEGGGITYDNATHYRYLDIDARVGSPELDNTHQVKGRSSWSTRYGGAQLLQLPGSDDTSAVRSAIWRYTDDAFKEAQENYTRVRANRAVTADEDDRSPDFSLSAPATFYEETAMPPVDKDAWRTRVAALSKRLLAHPDVYYGSVVFSVISDDRYFANSEGSLIRTGNNYVRLVYSISTRTQDGMTLSRFLDYNGKTAAELPPQGKMEADLDKSVAELEALRKAPVIEPFSGPAILSNRATAVFFHEILGHRLEGHRQKIETEGRTFARKMGQQIVSPIVSVADDPTLERFNGVALRGYYKFDDEGVPAQKAALVDHGILRSFLMNRSPIAAQSGSNGHGRREPGHPTTPRMGNTIVTAEHPVSEQKLHELLIAEIKKQHKPYGLYFDDISGGYTLTGGDTPQAFKVTPLVVYRVYPDGRPDELVRGADLIGTPIESFAKIIAAGDDPGIFNGTCGAESGWVPVSGVAPSVLVSEIEVQKVSNRKIKPPVLPPPYGAKEAK
jgi:predicted Zn-dependent protease